jgi:hypothetical protein
VVATSSIIGHDEEKEDSSFTLNCVNPLFNY